MVGEVAGLATLAGAPPAVHRTAGVLDGLLAFVVLYGVLWLVVVEGSSTDTGRSRVDRAFVALLLAGNLVLLLLALRVALTSVVSKLPSPRAERAARVTGRLPLVVSLSVVLPPLLLVALEVGTDRVVAPTPVALWVVAVVGLLAARGTASAREVERAQAATRWLASHDPSTGALLRGPFLDTMSRGGLRERSGTVIVLELQGMRELGDELGPDVAEEVMMTVIARVRAITGEGVLAKLTHERFAVLVRAADLGRARQVAAALQAGILEAVSVGGHTVRPVVSVGVAQADGAVIDVPAGVRRATVAMQHARRAATSRVVLDADVTGDLVERPGRGPA